MRLAEGAGFEPAIRFPVYTLSRRAPSTTRPPLRLGASGAPGSSSSSVRLLSRWILPWSGAVRIASGCMCSTEKSAHYSHTWWYDKTLCCQSINLFPLQAVTPIMIVLCQIPLGLEIAGPMLVCAKGGVRVLSFGVVSDGLACLDGGFLQGQVAIWPG